MLRFRGRRASDTFQPEVLQLEDRTLPSGASLLENAAIGIRVSSNPMGTPSPYGGISPSQMRAAYGIDNAATGNLQITFGNIGGDGRGQTIAIIDAYGEPNIQGDLAAFDSAFHLPAANLRVVNEYGSSYLPAADTGWGVEQALDVEWAHVIAPGANILLVEASSSNMSDLLNAINYARNAPGVSVVSMSWGGSEWSGEGAYDGYFTTPAGHNGVTFVASSGDNGSSDGPSYPAVSPYVVGVGGTQLSVDSRGDYLGEVGWSGSGGGVSSYYYQPAYQSGAVESIARVVPDVAFNASNNSLVPVYDTSGFSGWQQGGWGPGGWLGVYGTSMSAPQWAGLFAIADQGRVLAGEGTLDGPSQTLPLLYQLYQTRNSDFHDIVSGSNGQYSAQSGYDAVTGIGSPVANLLVPNLVNPSANPAIDPNAIFIGNVYRELLHREAGPSAQGWVNQLDSGVAPSTIISEIERSTEYLTDVVASLYQHYLRRGLDHGAQSWVNLLQAGGSIESVTAGLISSPEYFADHGDSDTVFIEGLYQDILGRSADSAGLNSWLAMLAGGTSRYQAAMGFLTSTEYRVNLVESYYSTYLGRPADAGGLAAWLQALQAGVTDQTILAAIFGSGGGYARWA